MRSVITTGQGISSNDEDEERRIMTIPYVTSFISFAAETRRPLSFLILKEHKHTRRRSEFLRIRKEE